MTLRKLMETIAEFNIPLNTEVFLKDGDDFVFQVGSTEIEHGFDNDSSYIVLTPRSKPVDDGNLHRVARKAIADDRNQTLENFDPESPNSMGVEYKDKPELGCIKFNTDELEALGKAVMVLGCATANEHTHDEVLKHVEDALGYLQKLIKEV